VPTWIVDGDRDEGIKREDTDHTAALIPGAGELILPNVSHFALLQDPEQFNEALLHFLSHPHSTTTKPGAGSAQLENSGAKAEQ
jgi:pimeloyl-ACP methyl ester carboxylesterase